MAVQVITMCYGSQKDIFLLCLVNEGGNGKVCDVVKLLIT